jgi:hypothetical protein
MPSTQILFICVYSNPSYQQEVVMMNKAPQFSRHNDKTATIGDSTNLFEVPHTSDRLIKSLKFQLFRIVYGINFFDSTPE